MKLATWNCNGLKACMKKGFLKYLQTAEPDIMAVQETRANTIVPKATFPNYFTEWSFAKQNGYSGTLCLFRKIPTSANKKLGDPSLDNDGRLICLEYPDIFFVNVCSPSRANRLKRLHYRQAWIDKFTSYVTSLQKRKPVIIAGEFNTAIEPSAEDLKNPKTDPEVEEGEELASLREAGLVDVFQEFRPTIEKPKTWWPSRPKSRKNAGGQRLDHFLVSACLMSKVKDCTIRNENLGSDRAPIEMTIAL